MVLIPVTAVAGESWLLGAAFATLLATAGLFVFGFFGLSTEPASHSPTDARWR